MTKHPRPQLVGKAVPDRQHKSTALKRANKRRMENTRQPRAEVTVRFIDAVGLLPADVIRARAFNPFYSEVAPRYSRVRTDRVPA